MTEIVHQISDVSLAAGLGIFVGRVVAFIIVDILVGRRQK